jgi:hypothetical protein
MRQVKDLEGGRRGLFEGNNTHTHTHTAARPCPPGSAAMQIPDAPTVRWRIFRKFFKSSLQHRRHCNKYENLRLLVINYTYYLPLFDLVSLTQFFPHLVIAHCCFIFRKGFQERNVGEKQECATGATQDLKHVIVLLYTPM